VLQTIYGSLVRRPWLRETVVTTPAIRQMAWRFIAGEDLNAALNAVRDLNARGIRCALNNVGTHVRKEADAVAAADAAVAALQRIHDQQIDSHLSVKLTAIGLDVDEEFCKTQLRRILECAGRSGNFVCVDTEESSYTERTLAIYEEMRQAYGARNVGIVRQSYLRHRTADLTRLVAGHSRIRLVKGGYWETSAVAWQSRADIDRAFRKDIDLLLTQGRGPAVATHDTRSIEYALRLAAQLGLGPREFEFQMLYGVRPDLQERLVRDGYTVRCYVPWGRDWYGYFLGCARRVPGGMLRRLGETGPAHFPVSA